MTEFKMKGKIFTPMFIGASIVGVFLAVFDELSTACIVYLAVLGFLTICETIEFKNK